MVYLFRLLSKVGWVWGVLVLAYLLLRLRPWKKSRGFDVIGSDEKQH